MDKESLLKAREILTQLIEKGEINSQDSLELVINLHHFLDPQDYEENVKVLSLNKQRKKYTNRGGNE